MCSRPALPLNVWSREAFCCWGYICRDSEAVRTGKDDPLQTFRLRLQRLRAAADFGCLLADGDICEALGRVFILMGLSRNQERKRFRSSLGPSICIRSDRMASSKVSLANHMRIMLRMSVVM
jgi:hypothetical protein